MHTFFEIFWEHKNICCKTFWGISKSLIFLLCLLYSITLCSCLGIYFLPSSRLFWNFGEFGAKKYFTDHWTADTIHLLASIKKNFLVYSFSKQVALKGNSSETKWHNDNRTNSLCHNFLISTGFCLQQMQPLKAVLPISDQIKLLILKVYLWRNSFLIRLWPTICNFTKKQTLSTLGGCFCY